MSSHIRDTAHPCLAAHRRRSLIICASFLLAILAAVLFADLPGTYRFMEEVQDSAHAGAFALIAWLLCIVVPHGTARRYALIFGMCAFLALATELVQYHIGRDASWSDIGRDLLGGTAMLLTRAGLDRRLDGFDAVKRWLFGGAVLATAIVAAPVGWSAAAYAHRAQQFPTLVDADSTLDLYFLSVTPESHTASGCHDAAGLYVPLSATKWPGVALDEPYPDWRGFSQLAIRLSNPAPHELTLTLRVSDARHNQRFEDRFNSAVAVPAAETRTWRIPLSRIERAPNQRLMDLGHIDELKIFAKEPQPCGFILHRIWLE